MPMIFDLFGPLKRGTGSLEENMMERGDEQP
jgi:hypothetical protein